MAYSAVGEELVRFNKDGAARVADPHGSHVDNAEKGRGAIFAASCLILGVGEEKERGLAVEDLEPEIMKRFGAGGGAPRGQSVGGEAGSDPIIERLRRGKGEGRRGGVSASHRHRVVGAPMAAGDRGGSR